MNRSILLPAFWLIATGGFAQSPKSTKTIGPVITFETTEHDYGTIPQGANGVCEFTFTNTGDEPLVISNCQTSCGCLVPSWDRGPVAPHKSAIIRLKYDTNRVGPFVKSATVTSNATNGPVIVLRIKGVVTPPDTLGERTVTPAIPTH